MLGGEERVLLRERDHEGANPVHIHGTLWGSASLQVALSFEIKDDEEIINNNIK